MAALQLCCHVLRSVLILLNVIFFAIGVTILSAGVYLFIQESTIAYYVTSNAVSGVVLMIITGCILASIALLGVIGPAISWKPLVIIYTVAMIVLIALELTAGGYTVASYSSLKSNVEEHMLNSIDKYGESSQDSDFVDFFQSQYDCCGYHNATDWIVSPHFNQSKELPTDCHCTVNSNSSCRVFGFYEANKVWTKGCSNSISSAIDKYSLTFGILAISLTTAQIFTLVLSFAFCFYKVYETRKTSYSPPKA